MSESQPNSTDWFKKSPVNLYQDIMAATMILTRVPVNWNFETRPDTQRSYWAFPIIGVGVAAIPGVVGALLISAGLPSLASAFLALGGIILLTGGLHQDGLADVADGLGGRDPEHRLKIMRDSAIGSFGTIALIIFIATTAVCLADLAEKSQWGILHSLVASAALSRAMMALQRALRNTPDDAGLAHLTGKPELSIAGFSLMLGLVLAATFVGINAAVIALLAAGAVTLALGWFLERWIGGVNGDGLGATQQISETVILMTFVMIL
jgi:adenosylcobinamide-GDP ribazoletransferase